MPASVHINQIGNAFKRIKTNSHRKQHIFLEHIGKLEKDQKRRVAQNADSQPEFALLDSLGAGRVSIGLLFPLIYGFLENLQFAPVYGFPAKPPHTRMLLFSMKPRHSFAVCIRLRRQTVPEQPVDNRHSEQNQHMRRIPEGIQNQAKRKQHKHLKTLRNRIKKDQEKRQISKQKFQTAEY